MMSDILYAILHIPLVDKSLQSHLYRIHNIPLAHPILQKSFKYSIQEEYLAIRSDSQYMTKVYCQMDTSVTLILLYMKQILQILVVMPLSFHTKKE